MHVTKYVLLDVEKSIKNKCDDFFLSAIDIYVLLAITNQFGRIRCKPPQKSKKEQ
jgi:hypothetical protein